MAFGFSFHGVVSFALTIFSFLKNKNRATSLRMEQSPNQVTKILKRHLNSVATRISTTPEVTSHLVNCNNLFQTYWWF